LKGLTMKHLKPLSLSAIALLQMACAQALSPVVAVPSAVPSQGTQTLGTVGEQVGVMVRDTVTQTTLPIYLHRGEYWVAGVPGQGYELWLTSRVPGRRVLATTSVDGINVITGQTAAPVGRGYVLSPYSMATVSGWRKSEHEVAAFRFAAPQASYAAQTGRPANVGVIGVAVFPELQLPPPPPVYRPAPVPVSPAKETSVFNSGKHADAAGGSVHEKSKMQAPGAAAPSMAAERVNSDTSANAKQEAAAPSAAMKRSASPSVAQGLGTQHGERMASYAPTVAFKRESNSPAELITLRYDTTENLVARGVLQWHQAYYQPKPIPAPQPFPKSGYVPDPPFATPRPW
jgi:hypothetical protein